MRAQSYSEEIPVRLLGIDEAGGSFEFWRRWDKGYPTFAIVSSFNSGAIQVAMLNGTNAV